MWPWLWIFAPQTYLPLSGAVTQDLVLDAFFRGIGPGAGVPSVEKRVFEQASYGKQLGWLTDVLVATTDPAKLPPGEAQKSFESLHELYEKIKTIKDEHRRDRLGAAKALLERIADDDPEALRSLLRDIEARARDRM